MISRKATPSRYILALTVGLKRAYPSSMKATIEITLKTEVLDPQGDAVCRSLGSLGIDGVSNLRIGKLVHLSVDADSKEAAEEKLETVCAKLLANPVIEDYQYRIDSE